jgi:hypothetical protein
LYDVIIFMVSLIELGESIKESFLSPSVPEGMDAKNAAADGPS